MLLKSSKKFNELSMMNTMLQCSVTCELRHVSVAVT